MSTVDREAGLPPGRLVRRCGLALVALDLALIGGAILRYPAVLAQPGGATYALEPIVPLGCYAAATILLLRGNASPALRRALRSGTLVGLVAGALWVVNLTLETFSDLGNRLGLLATAPFFVGAFVLWGVAGVIGGRQTGTIGLGVLAAVWAAMVCVLITVTCGLLLAHTALPQLEHNLANDPDFVRSQWPDLRAFAYANTFNAAASHLLIAPSIGALVGVLSGSAGAWWRRLGGSPQTPAGTMSRWWSS